MKSGIFAAAIGACVIVSACSGGAGPSQVPAADASIPEGGLTTSCGGREETLSIQGATHVEGDLVYKDPPPASGDHNPCWSEWGVHAEAVGDEHWVHNLEHGGIVYLYNCEKDCTGQVNEIAQFVKDHDRSLLTPYASLPTKYGVVAWGHRLLSDCYDADAFASFYRKHFDHGPESLADGPPDGCH